MQKRGLHRISDTPLYSPIDGSFINSMRGRISKVIVFIDDIYRVFLRLMAPNQMFNHILRGYDEDLKKQISSLEGIYIALYNIISLLYWREMEISLSRQLANALGVDFYIVATNHPKSMVWKLIKLPKEKLRMYYLSHPISYIRKNEKDTLSSLPGQLKLSVGDVFNSDNVILFIPTSIDELIFDTYKEGSKEYVRPAKLAPRWPHPCEPPELLSPDLPTEVANIVPINPLNHEVKSEEKDEITRLFNLLFAKFIYKKQIMSRDYSLVEQSKNGVIAIRPFYGGEKSEGMMGEIGHNVVLMESQRERFCYVFSCHEDINSYLLGKLVSYFHPKDSVEYDLAVKKLKSKNVRLLRLSNEEVIELAEKTVGPPKFDFVKACREHGKEITSWGGGDAFSKERQAKDELFALILKDLRTDAVESERSIVSKRRFVYDIYEEGEIWDRIRQFINSEILEKRRKGNGKRTSH